MSSRTIRSSPLRPPQWRHRRALYYLAAGVQPLETNEDRPTIVQFRFLRRLRRCGRGRNRWKLMAQQRNLWLALDIYSDTKADLKAILEARLLSGEGSETIATKTGFSAEVVECYELVYFDIRDRLDFSDFIHGQVLGCDSGSTGSSARGCLLKRIGYCAGPEALDLVLKTRPPTSSQDIDPVQALNRYIESVLLEKTFASADHADPSSEQSIRTMLQNFARQQDARAKHGILSPGQESYQRNVEALLKGLPFGLASRDMPEELQSWADIPAELRADEMWRVMAGETLENEKELRNVKPREPNSTRK